MITSPSISLLAEITRRINLECDRVTYTNDTIYFYFDTSEKWERVFNGMAGIYDAVIRSLYLGFTNYVFVKHDGTEYGTTKAFWIPIERNHRRSSRVR